MTQFQKGHKTNLGRKRGPMSERQKTRLSEIAKQRKQDKAHNWKGGKRYIRGYVLIYCPWHPFCTDKRYVMEHRFVMEAILGRFLEPTEVVHHINGIRDDNRVENLEVMSKNKHDSLETKKRWLKGEFEYKRDIRNRDSLGRFLP